MLTLCSNTLSSTTCRGWVDHKVEPHNDYIQTCHDSTLWSTTFSVNIAPFCRKKLIRKRQFHPSYVGRPGNHRWTSGNIVDHWPKLTLNVSFCGLSLMIYDALLSAEDIFLTSTSTLQLTKTFTIAIPIYLLWFPSLNIWQPPFSQQQTETLWTTLIQKHTTCKQRPNDKIRDIQLQGELIIKKKQQQQNDNDNTNNEIQMATTTKSNKVHHDCYHDELIYQD